MSKKVFISYVETDIRYKNKLKKWEEKQKLGPHSISLTSRDDEDVRSRSGKVVRSKVIKKIAEAEFVVVIIGRYNREHPWMKYEGLVRKLRKKCYYMRIPYTDAPLPRRLSYLPQIAFNPNAIDKLLREQEEKEAGLSNTDNIPTSTKENKDVSVQKEAKSSSVVIKKERRRTSKVKQEKILE